jgi:TldD protein
MDAPTAVFEHSRSRFLIVEPGRISGRMTCEGRLGRIDDGTAVHRFCGDPPRGWIGVERVPGEARGEEPLESALLGLEAAVTHSSCESVRVSIVAGIRGPERCTRAWSATARVANVQVGWSGAGDGLAQLANIAGEMRSLAEALHRARPLESGTIATVLAAPAAAVLLHESVGHLIEALPGRASLAGHRVAAECITAMDDPTRDGAPGTYEYDDENVRAMGPTVAVREGRIVAELHSTATAALTGALSTGNARAASVWQEPLPRVSNLLCTGGDGELDELVDRCGDGILVHRLANGINNGVRVQADIVLAERIARGRRTGTMLTGGRIDETVSVALRIVEAGREARFNGNAMCGKSGQLLFNVGTCAPPLRFAALRIAA